MSYGMRIALKFRARLPRIFATSFMLPQVAHPTTQSNGCLSHSNSYSDGRHYTIVIKMYCPLILGALSLLHAARCEQPSAPSPVSSPLRELPWGDLNFLHTTDTHGWIAGHLGESESSYGADWGDYISFAEHLKKKAEQDGSDLLLIDTGDRIEGSGLYDASHPKGNFSREIFAEQDIDVICIGNHELVTRRILGLVDPDCAADCTEDLQLRMSC